MYQETIFQTNYLLVGNAGSESTSLASQVYFVESMFVDSVRPIILCVFDTCFANIYLVNYT